MYQSGDARTQDRAGCRPHGRGVANVERMPTMTQFTRRSLFAVAALPVALSAAPAVAEDAHEKQLREDFAWLGKYAAENAALKASGKPVGVVFMGDSITEGWKGKHPDFFATAGRV